MLNFDTKKQSDNNQEGMADGDVGERPTGNVALSVDWYTIIEDAAALAMRYRRLLTNRRWVFQCPPKS